VTAEPVKSETKAEATADTKSEAKPVAKPVAASDSKPRAVATKSCGEVGGARQAKGTGPQEQAVEYPRQEALRRRN
jgi:hypothetical protein